MYSRRLIVGLCLCSLCSLRSFAQEFENIRPSQEGSRLIVLYDLSSARSNATFTIALYGSHNNYSAPVARVTGDVGQGQKPGKDKRIEWDLRELETFRGQITIELGGIPEAVKLAFKNPFISGKTKQGKSAQIAWTGGTLEPNVKIEVYRKGVISTALGERKNTGSTDWKIPSDLPKGSGYTIRISAGDERIESQPFSIKGKASKFLIAASAAGAAGTGVIMWLIYRPVEEAPDPN